MGSPDLSGDLGFIENPPPVRLSGLNRVTKMVKERNIIVNGEL